jgi:hypothetical protein
MIRYSLICARKHEFESWFQNSDSYDKQVKRGLVSCPHCGSEKVEKALMAPRLAGTKKRTSKAKAQAPVDTGAETPSPVAIMPPEAQEFRQKLRELRDHLTKNSDNVGKKFPEEARKMHYGEVEHRSIYGEASPDDARALHEEGIEFHPLPNLPDDKN